MLIWKLVFHCLHRNVTMLQHQVQADTHTLHHTIPPGRAEHLVLHWHNVEPLP